MKLLIVDDEPLARRRLRDLVGEIGGHEVLAEAEDGRTACELAANLEPDLVLLDIAMPGMDGLEAAHHLSELPKPPAVVFCTAWDEHALAAFDAQAIDYLVKPIRRERLAAALQRGRRFQASAGARATPRVARRSHLSARLRGELRLIPVAEIRYLQAEEKYVVVHHARGEDLIEDSLKSLEAEFSPRFLRIHRSTLVAASQIAMLTRNETGRDVVQLRHPPVQLEVSRRCLPGVRRQLKEL